MTYRADIQILRAFAVIMVLFYHLQFVGFKNGFLGVDIFFVVSGYLMAMLYDKSSTKIFYINRFKRIFPAYILTISLTTFVVALIASPADFSLRFDRVWFDLFGLSNFAFWLEDSYFDYQNFKPLLNIWSLGVEIQYYLIAPLILPFLRKKKTYLVITIISFMSLTLWVSTFSTKTSFFLTPFRIWEFLIGAYIAWHTKNDGNNNEIIITTISIMCLVLLFIFFPISTISSSIYYGHPGIASIFTTFLIAIILKYPIPHKIISDKNIINNFLIKIGDYSYSIYLVHFPIIVIFNYTPFEGTSLKITNNYILSLTIITILAASVLMHKYVELRRFKSSFSKFFYIILSISLLFIFSSNFISKTKFNRLTIEEKKIFNSYYDKNTYRCGTKFKLTKPFETICQINKFNNLKKVILLGDSHANSLKKVFNNNMSQNQISSYFYASHFPLIQSRHLEKIIFKNIIQSEITHVILHFNPDFYKSQIYLDELSLLIKRLNDSKIKIDLIAPVPIATYHVPRALYRKAKNFDKELKKITVNDYFEKNKIFFSFIKMNSSKFNTIYYPHRYLCPNTIECLIDVDGIPLFFDSNHLTITGANILNPIFNIITQNIIKNYNP